MFEADQFHHQFIDSRTTPNSLPLLLSFPNSNFNASSSAFSTFDSFNSSSSQLHPNFLHSTNSPKIEHKGEQQNHTMLPPMNLDTQSDQRDRSVDPWSTDELLTLFRIRSSMENWFPDFTWDHVSRKLAEFGFKKSAEMCKEKFEEESRYLNNMNSNNFPKNYRVFGEFEDLYNSDNNNINNNNNNQNPHQVASEKNKKLDKAKDNCQGEEDKIEEQDSKIDQTLIMLDQNKDSKEEVSDKLKSGSSKRKRDKCSTSSSTTNSSSSNSNSNSSSSFEMFKGFCQDIISTIIAQQEQMHNKLLEDMARRDQEKIAREEEWKKQELDRIDKELQLRAQEQVVSCDRQASIITFLNQFSSIEKISNSNSSSTSSSSSSLPILPLNPNPNPNQPISSLSSTIDKDSIFSPPKENPIKPTSITLPNDDQNPKDSIFSPPKDNPIKPTSITLPNDDQNPKDSIFLPPNKDNPIKPNSKKHDHQNPNPKPPITVTTSNEHDLGKRWPKDEVLALINLRCSLYNSNEEDMTNKESSAKTVPLWERISKGMFELGYKRSSKRCKEKWENINKYFRKTKDVNKKRSLDSRTCPYFHQLSTLYSQGKLVNAANSSDLGTDNIHQSAKSSTTTSTSTLVQVDDKNPVQASGFEFEF